MMTFSHKVFIVLASIVLLAAGFWAAWLGQPALLFLPLALMAILYFIQYPELLFYTLLFSIPWSFEYNFNESLGTDLPDEPLMLLMAFVAVALLIVHRKKNLAKQGIHPLLLLVVLQVAWIMITVVASTHFIFSIKYFLAKTWYLLAFMIAPLLRNHPEKLIKRSAVVLFVSMFMVTCIILYKHAFLGFTFIGVKEAVVPFFRNHVNYSALLVFMLPLPIAFYRLTKNKGLRFLIVVSFLLVLSALYFSYARGAWLALVIGLPAFWLMQRGWLLKSFLLAVFLVTGFVIWLKQNDRYLQFAPHHDVTIFHTNFSEHLAATYQGKDVSTAERFYRWVAGARMSTDKWFTGFGPTTFYENYKPYTLPVFRTWVSNNKEHSTVHNYFLLLLIEQGVIGLLLFMVLIGAMFWYAQKIYHRTNDTFWKVTVATIASILWMQCTVNFLSDLIETDKVGSVFYLCVAFLIVADSITRIKTNYTN